MTERYREIKVSGSCRQMGQQTGEAARDEIRGFVAAALERMHQSIRISRERFLGMISASTSYVEAYAPDLLQELHGLAESSGVPFDDLMFLQIRNQLTPSMDSGCTSFSAGPSVSFAQPNIVGQNWDNDPALDTFTIVLTRRPADRPAFMSVTQAGLIAYIGCNEAGIGVCLNALPAPMRAAGVPHYFTLRRIFEGRTLDAAVTAVASAHRAIPANIMLATPQGPANLEVTINAVHVLHGEKNKILTHTNHCLHPQLLAINDQFAELIQSKPRLQRINELFNGACSSLSIDEFKAALRDHQDFPRSICRHTNENPTHGFWATVFSVILVPDSGEMHIARGAPCQHEYEIYRLNS